MVEPKNHTLVLLREIRAALSDLDDKTDRNHETLNRKIDRNHDDLLKRIEALRQAAFGESVLGR